MLQMVDLEAASSASTASAEDRATALGNEAGFSNTDADQYTWRTTNKGTSLPPRHVWKRQNCCVPLDLLLENFDVKVQRARLQRGILFYIVWIIVLLIFAFWAFGRADSALLYTGAQIHLSLSSTAFFSHSYILFDQIAATQIVNTDADISVNRTSPLHERFLQDTSCPAAEVKTVDELSTEYKQQIRPYDVDSLQEYFAYHADILSLRLCQPGSALGVCHDVSNQAQKRSMVSPADSGLLVEFDAEDATDIDWFVSSVELHPSSDTLCFAGFNDGDDGPDDNLLNRLWTESIASTSALASFDRCLAIPYGSQSGCFIGTRDWHMNTLNTSLSNASFVERIQDLQYTMQVNFLNESTAESNAYEFAWVDGNTRTLSTAVVTVNEPAKAMFVARLSFQISLSGMAKSSQQVLALAQLGDIATQNGDLNAVATFVAVVLILAIAYIGFGTLFPLARACCAIHSRSTRIAHYRKYRSWWDAVDFVLLALYCFFLVLLQTGIQSNDFDFSSSEAGPSECESESFGINFNRIKQIMALLLLCIMLRIMKYISLVPALSQTWTAIVSGFFYYTPALIILMMLWVVFAMVNLIVLHHRYEQFNSFYNAILAILTMHIDSGSSAWTALMQGQHLTGTPSEAATDTTVRFFVYLWLFEFFVVIPFAALAISAFYFSIVFTDAHHRQRSEQAIADARASKAEAVLARLRENAANALRPPSYASFPPALAQQRGNNTYGGDQDVEGRDQDDDNGQEFATRLDKILDSYARFPDEQAGVGPSPVVRRLHAWATGLRVSVQNAGRSVVRGFRRARQFCSLSERSLATPPDLAQLPSRFIGENNALYRLQVFAVRPENVNKVFVSYSEIAAVIGTKPNGKRVAVPEKMILDIMSLVGSGNVYYANVKLRHEMQSILRSNAKALNKPSAADIAAAEGRRRRINIAQWQDAKTDVAEIHAMTERLRKLEDSSKFSLEILLHDFRNLHENQNRMLADIESIRQSINLLRSPRVPRDD
ncbi:Hypothetical Protein FCC1311_085102 [Hondaea fermentalgiana]|uniref:Uncharacterized protein n=1 Tax=Hondaea fermentalgiana TaxID=2315210 RepID=A0A2R5GNT6_9STRA|nr:Hypothetical Protein FCC1311_085102 [Hondaea fermentalgiana]|eukprot:GBG32285.1 Hypothetical Protein FCC1311_085102 [Hondaea fermentalgiana]